MFIHKSVIDETRIEMPVESVECLVGDSTLMLNDIAKLYVTNNEASPRRLENDARSLRFEPSERITE